MLVLVFVGVNQASINQPTNQARTNQPSRDAHTHAPRHCRARPLVHALRVGPGVVGGAVGDDGGQAGHLPLVDVPVVEEKLARGGVHLGWWWLGMVGV